MYENTGPRSHVMAADLIAAGVDVHEIYRRLYEGVPEPKLALLTRALAAVERYDDGRLTLARLTREDFAETGAEESYTEGIIDHLRSVQGTKVAALARELTGRRPRAAARRSRCARPTAPSTCRSSRARRAAAGTARRPASRRRWTATSSSRSCASRSPRSSTADGVRAPGGGARNLAARSAVASGMRPTTSRHLLARPRRSPPRCRAARPPPPTTPSPSSPATRPIAAYGGALAWSAYDAASERYGLVIRQRRRRRPRPRASRPRGAPSTSASGPDARGRVVALYTRCRTARRTPSAAATSTATTCARARAQARVGLVAVARRGLAGAVARARSRSRAARARASSTATTTGPIRAGAARSLDCDIPYVKTLSSRAPSRRLDRSQCGATDRHRDPRRHDRPRRRHQPGRRRLGDAGAPAARARRRRARSSPAPAGGEGGYSPFVVAEPVGVGGLADAHRPPRGRAPGLPAHRPARRRG